jgi:hypothetical protein
MMDLISLAILVIVVVACIAIVAWFVRSSGLTIPQPLLIVCYAALAIVAILVLVGLAGMGPMAVNWR